MDSSQLKQTVKEAVAEALRDERGMLRDIVEDVLEELAMVRAMREADTTERATREDVFKALESGERTLSSRRRFSAI